MVVVVEPRHRLATRRHVDPEDFARERLLLDLPREESAFFRDLLAPARVTPAAVQIVGQTSAMVELVVAGLGVAVLARWAVEPLVQSGVLRALALTRGGHRRQWRAITLKTIAELAYVRSFIEIVARLAQCCRRKGNIRRSA